MSAAEKLLAEAFQIGRALTASLDDLHAHVVRTVGREITPEEFQQAYGGALQRQIDEIEKRARLEGLTDDETLAVMRAIPEGATIAIDGGVQ